MSGTTQVYNPGKVDIDSSHFPKRNDVGLAWGRAISSHQFLPQIRGVWPFSAVNSAGALLDLSGNGQTATNNGPAAFSLFGITPYAVMNGAEHFSIASAGANRITGALTLAAWVFFDGGAGATEGIISKWVSAGQQCYRIYKSNAEFITFEITTTGTVITSVVSTVPIVQNTWYRVIAEFQPPTALNLWVNGVKDTNTTSIPATLFDSATSALEFGRTDGGSNMSGGLTLISQQASAINSALAMVLFDYTRPLFGAVPA